MDNFNQNRRSRSCFRCQRASNVACDTGPSHLFHFVLPRVDSFLRPRKRQRIDKEHQRNNARKNTPSTISRLLLIFIWEAGYQITTRNAPQLCPLKRGHGCGETCERDERNRDKELGRKRERERERGAEKGTKSGIHCEVSPTSKIRNHTAAI